MTTFWAWFVAVGTIGFIIWAAWLILWSAKQGPQGKEDSELVGHKWDGDLEEWNNPTPRWWLYLYFITIIFGIGYLILFPGLGVFDGVRGWSQEGQYEKEMREAAERYEPIYAEFAAMDFETRAADPEAQKLGASLYASYCTTCHGSDARGAVGFPNLADADWQWGSSEDAIYASIYSGRQAVMTPWAQILGSDEAVENMVSYVRSLSGLEEAGESAASAQTQFTTFCAACHMPTGTGNPILGAPNLTDDAWLYGSSRETIRETIEQGRQGQMPAHGALLGENRTKILAAYVYSLSQ
jgi:cytochrome c oxidase cbb3-type subunit 3